MTEATRRGLLGLIGICVLGSSVAAFDVMRSLDAPLAVGSVVVALYAAAVLGLGFEATRFFALGFSFAGAPLVALAILLLFVFAYGLSGYGGRPEPSVFFSTVFFHPLYRRLGAIGILETLVATLSGIFIVKSSRHERRLRRFFAGVALFAFCAGLAMLAAARAAGDA